MKRVNNNLELLQSVIDVFIAESPDQIQGLQQALKDIDWQEARHFVHIIKGNAANLSGLALQQKAKEFEALVKNQKTDEINVLLPDFLNAYQQLISTLEKQEKSAVSDGLYQE